MNFSNPILICDQNPDFRNLLREILIKNGYFHVLEASTPEEATEILNAKKDFFVLIEGRSLTREVMNYLLQQRNFIVLTGNDDSQVLKVSVELGVNHIMTYPFHSRKLIEKMNSLTQ